MEELILVEPDETHETAVADYIAEHKALGEPKLNGAGGLRRAKSYAQWLESLRNDKAGVLVDDRYPADEYLAFRKSDGRLIGMTNIRRRLINDKAFNFDGHIGYAVRPSERRRGYASQILALAVEKCAQNGILRALLTCDEQNEASVRTIVRSGGVLEDRRQEPDGTWILRYWIDTSLIKEGKNTLAIGMKYSHSITVTPEMTAMRMKSGALDVFATPLMIAEMENCCLECVRTALQPGRSTVGTLVNIRHLAATPVGMTVRFECTLVDIDRRRLVFDVRAFDECGLIGEGTHERFDVDCIAFEQKARDKAKNVR